MIVAFSGSRSLFPHLCSELVGPHLAKVNRLQDLVVVGDALGVDEYVREYCREKKIACAKFFAYWDDFGKKAGPMRNEQMAMVAEYLYAFPGPKSVGTTGMIQLCTRYIGSQNVTVTQVPR